MAEGIIDIADADQLYRRLHRGALDPDGTVNSTAFKTHGKPDSSILVDLAQLTTPEESLAMAGRPGFALGSLLAGVAREQLRWAGMRAEDGQRGDKRFCSRRIGSPCSRAPTQQPRPLHSSDLCMPFGS